MMLWIIFAKSASGALIHRDDATANVKMDYIRAAGKTIARVKGSAVSYMHQDHLGSTVASTTAAGAIAWREDFTPYGEKRLDPNANKDDEGFTGHVDDAATGLTYMQARYYDPVIGRFLSNDPVGFLEGGVGYFNRYAYTMNNPINRIDPDGKQSVPGVGMIQVGCANSTNPNCARNILNGAREASPVILKAAQVVSLFVPGAAIIRGGVLTANAARIHFFVKSKNGFTAFQTKSLAKFFGKGSAGAKAALSKVGQSGYKLPRGVTVKTLRKYKSIAEKIIKEQKKPSQVQKERLEVIDKALEKFDK